MTKRWQVIGVLAVGGLVIGACSSSGGNQTGTGGTTGSAGATGAGGSIGGQGGTTGSAGATGTAGTTGSGGASGTGGAGGSTTGCVTGAGGGAGTTGSAGTTGAGGSIGGHGGTIGSAGATGGGGTAGGAGTTGAGGVAGAGGAGGTPPTCTDFPSMASGTTTFTVTSSEYTSCNPIPAARTCDQKEFPMGSSPAITWTAGPANTMSYAVVFKDLSVLARYPSTDANDNKGFHYAIWDIPADRRGLPANMMGGHLSTDIPGARQWSNFNDYGWFGPCPNFDPTMPTTYNDTYAFIVYALPTAKATIPAAQAGISTVRLMDGVFKTASLATAEYRGTSNASSTGIPAGILPPSAKPLCATDGTPVLCGCLSGP